ncbi:2-C-methyl-D-erythritol 4-phosphate cytidylyltransferase [Ammoniphilus sp. CFH 90114]|uniref:2-C-methyl-D-erythritol 4-phosphate cytidylyltransferase n=1 Tax=Ammoniphilus sp. CFH 90114 TaxID=2493665 RepID=UPI00100E4BA0|nr:2-C-methyl-D-erythritol 4-phosphate cytidylyltransferase [Ammoniphilus sp. CFH 90114]RXT09051.1 2-C-methyl-D-erythritol 4-phosphate cytidylyltransferase [Ammoniphilus sp. CFH 90114]
MVSCGVVIAAAGQGKRMGAADKKQFIQLNGKPVLYHTVHLFAHMPELKEIVVVTNAEDISRTEELLKDFPHIQVVAGGAERQHSVYLGLQALRHVEYAMIHDAARPFATIEMVRRVLEKTIEMGAAIPAVPVKDTIKIVDENREVVNTPSRQSLWAVQTPQAFRLFDILQAHREAMDKGFLGTDDAMLFEWLGRRVSVVEGEYTNIKLTTPEDLKVAETIMEKRRR